MKKYTRKEMLGMYREDYKDLPVREVFRRIMLMLSLIWNESRGLVILKFLCIVLSAANSLIGTLYLMWIIDALTGGAELMYVLKMIVAIHILFLVIGLPQRILQFRVYPVMQRRVQCAMKMKLMDTVMKKDLGDFEDRKFFEDNVVTFASTDSTAFLFLDSIGRIFEVLLTGASLIAVFASIDAYILLFVGAMLIAMTVQQQWSRVYNQLTYLEEEKIGMVTNYYQRIANNPEFAAEVRCYSMREFVLGKFCAAYRKAIETYNFFLGKDQKSGTIADAVINYIIQPALLFYLAYRVFSGSMGIGSFSVAFSAAFKLNGTVFTLISSYGTMKFNCSWAVERYIRATKTKGSIETQNTPDKLSLSGKEIRDVEFRNVSFRYPRHDKIVLDDLSFSLPKGKKIAIVGRNGAGKSTLVKLLLRLYDTDQGEILINGRNICDYNIDDIRRSFSLMLQDFCTYQMTVAENVRLSEYDGNEKDRTALYEALAYADIDQKVACMKHKENSMVGRLFDDDGEALSGGEKQRLALARGYLRAKSAGIFILDEPNSSLDPISEYELNKKLMSVLSDQTIVFITHRLSTTVLADEILYVENGQVLERGTHEELIALDGKYADMFNKQAEAYRLESKMKEIKDHV